MKETTDTSHKKRKTTSKEGEQGEKSVSQSKSNKEWDHLIAEAKFEMNKLSAACMNYKSIMSKQNKN